MVLTPNIRVVRNVVGSLMASTQVHSLLMRVRISSPPNEAFEEQRRYNKPINNAERVIQDVTLDTELDRGLLLATFYNLGGE